MTVRRQAWTMANAAAVLAAFAVSVASAADGVKPPRIVSMNLCTDQLVMMLADREYIASLSYAAADPDQSLVADKVGGIPLNKGLAEEIIPLAPDIIFSGSFTTTFSDQLLRGLGYTIVEMPLSENLDDVRRNIQTAADAIGAPERGIAMVRDLNEALRAARVEAAEPAAALVMLPGGFTPGRNSIAHEILELGGLRNVASDLNVSYWTNITLEALLRAGSDVIIVDPQNKTSRALATQFLEHPVLRHHMGARTIIEVPSKLWGCGTPFVAKALEIIADARRRSNTDRVQ